MPYNTRSTTRHKQAQVGEATVSPSATGSGTHIRWIYATPSSPTPPELSYGSSGSSVTSSPVTPPNINNNTGYPSREQGGVAYPFATEDEKIARCAMMALQAHKTAAETSLREWDSVDEYSEAEMIEEEYALDDGGRPLPKGIKGLGPHGTFLVSDGWHPQPSEDDPATTDQLPTINEGAEMDIDSGNGPSGPEFVQGSSREGAATPGDHPVLGLPEFVPDSRRRRHLR